MMFTEAMIAPCGLDCSLCVAAHDRDQPCRGCTGPDKYKREFCATRCTIAQCEKRKKTRYRFCDQCPDFPCEAVQERENRYQSQYPLKESPLTNLRKIRDLGMNQFLEEERARWTCKDCGGVISVHEGICAECGRQYSEKG